MLAGQPWPPSASLSSQHWINVRAERERHHRTRKLGHWASNEVGGSVLSYSLSYLFKETSSTIVSTLKWSENVAGPLDYASSSTKPLTSKRRGSCFLSYLFRSSGTIVSTFERIENVASLFGPLMHLPARHEGCGLQVHLYLCMLMHFIVQGTDQEHHACKL